MTESLPSRAVTLDDGILEEKTHSKELSLQSLAQAWLAGLEFLFLRFGNIEKTERARQASRARVGLNKFEILMTKNGKRFRELALKKIPK